MNIELSKNEVNELVLVLESFIPEFNSEIDSILKADLQDELKNDAVILNNVLNKLRGLKQC